MAEDPAALGRLRILIIDDEANIRLQLALCLEAENHHVVSHGNIHDAMADASWQVFDLIFLDLRLGLDNGLDFIARLLAESPWAKLIVITAYASVDTAVEAMKRGAADYLAKPFTPAQVRLVTQKVSERRRLERKVEAMQAALGGIDPEADLPTASPAMARTLELARQVASSNATVLIRGELGTGKGRLARAIHAWSNRSAMPLGSVLCQAPSADFLDADLFGMSAREPREACVRGWVPFCDGGTLLLDEVGELPLSLQPKLLRLLRDREYERHDDFKVLPADVRVLATTSSDLQGAVNRGRLRADLLLALEVVRIDVPPLRQRPEDVRLLASRYLAWFGRENHRPIQGFSEAALELLDKHGWPGNVRELRNVIERAVLLCKADLIGVEHLPLNLSTTPTPFAIGDMVSLEAIENLHIRRVVASTKSIATAASILGIHSGTILRRLRRAQGLGERDDGSAGPSPGATHDRLAE
jgi:NtrC-family two-component system response regulator AlgB